ASGYKQQTEITVLRIKRLFRFCFARHTRNECINLYGGQIGDTETVISMFAASGRATGDGQHNAVHHGKTQTPGNKDFLTANMASRPRAAPQTGDAHISRARPGAALAPLPTGLDTSGSLPSSY